MNLYNSYCYSSLDAAALSFYSKGIIDNVGLLSSYSVVLPDTVNFTYLPISEIEKNNPVYASFSIRFPECNSLGFDNSFFGVTPADSLLISGAVVLVLCSAYGFKIIRKMLGV